MYKSEKTSRIAARLKTLQRRDNETLRKISEVIFEKVEFYDSCLKAWDNPKEKFTPEEVELGKQCSHAGLDMAGSIVNELRIIFLKPEQA